MKSICWEDKFLIYTILDRWSFPMVDEFRKLNQYIDNTRMFMASPQDYYFVYCIPLPHFSSMFFCKRHSDYDSLHCIELFVLIVSDKRNAIYINMQPLFWFALKSSSIVCNSIHFNWNIKVRQLCNVKNLIGETVWTIFCRMLMYSISSSCKKQLQ